MVDETEDCKWNFELTSSPVQSNEIYECHPWAEELHNMQPNSTPEGCGQIKCEISHEDVCDMTSWDILIRNTLYNSVVHIYLLASNIYNGTTEQQLVTCVL